MGEAPECIHGSRVFKTRFEAGYEKLHYLWTCPDGCDPIYKVRDGF